VSHLCDSGGAGLNSAYVMIIIDNFLCAMLQMRHHLQEKNIYGDTNIVTRLWYRRRVWRLTWNLRYLSLMSSKRKHFVTTCAVLTINTNTNALLELIFDSTVCFSMRQVFVDDVKHVNLYI